MLTSAIGTPTFSTLLRSMSANTCGTFARYSVLMRPISGRFRAAPMNAAACWASHCGVCPTRSCSSIVKPAPVPRPGIAGGPNAATTASGTSFAKARFSSLIIPLECNSAVLRSFHSLSWTKKKPMFDEYAPVSRLNPLMVL